MQNPSSNIFDEKVSLIYEYDKDSPLFIRMAYIEIEKNNVEKAINILEKGLEKHPGYAAVYMLLGKAHTLLGNYSKALKFVKKGSELIYSPRSYEHYLKEIEAIKKQRSLFESTRDTNFAEPSSQLKEIEKELLPKEEKKIDPDKIDIAKIDDKISRLRNELIELKNQAFVPDEETSQTLMNLSKHNPIISETLAKIYASQGEFNEAISIYKQLIPRNPERRSYYESKISELESRLKS